jgi:chromosome segregation ATPase
VRIKILDDQLQSKERELRSLSDHLRILESQKSDL